MGTRIETGRRMVAFGLIMTITAMVMMVTGPAFATQPVDGEHKQTICHRTSAVNNPYVLIEVDVAAIDGQGQQDHDHHDDPVFTSADDYSGSNKDWGDIIPPTVIDGVVYNDGLNWDARGMEIYNNGCQLPDEETTTTGEETTTTGVGNVVEIVPALPYLSPPTCPRPDGDRVIPDDTDIIDYTDQGDTLLAEIIQDGYVFDEEATEELGYEFVSDTVAIYEFPDMPPPEDCDPSETTTTAQTTTTAGFNETTTTGGEDSTTTSTGVNPTIVTTTTVGPTTSMVGQISTTTIPPVTPDECDEDDPLYDAETGLCELPFTGPSSPALALIGLGLLSMVLGAGALWIGNAPKPQVL